MTQFGDLQLKRVPTDPREPNEARREKINAFGRATFRGGNLKEVCLIGWVVKGYGRWKGSLEYDSEIYVAYLRSKKKNK